MQQIWSLFTTLLIKKTKYASRTNPEGIPNLPAYLNVT